MLQEKTGLLQETTDLLQLFTDTSNLGFLDLLERPALKFPPRTIREGAPNSVYPPLPVLKATYPTLGVLLDALEHATAKFDFLRTSQADWQRFYLFPRGINEGSISFLMTSEEERRVNSDYVVSRSKAHALNWLQRLLAHINPDPDNPYADLRAPRRRVTYILGKVGSGSSPS